MDDGCRRESESRTLLWAFSKHPWWGQSDFCRRPASEKDDLGTSTMCWLMTRGLDPRKVERTVWKGVCVDSTVGQVAGGGPLLF